MSINNFFFFNDTATTEIYTLSLHDALPISSSRNRSRRLSSPSPNNSTASWPTGISADPRDRKSTRLNSSHSQISYAVFCLKKKMKEYVKSNLHSRHRSICRVTTLFSHKRQP